MYREIVVPIGNESTGFAAVPTAAELSRKAGVALSVLSLLDEEPPSGRDHDGFERHLAELEQAQVDTVVNGHGTDGDAIVEYADAADRLICMASRGSHLRHPLRGDVTERVACESSHPILTVGRRCDPDRRTGIHRLIVPLDGTQSGEHALDVATLWAMDFDLEVEIVQVHHVRHHPAPGPVGERSPATSDVLESASVRGRAREIARRGVAVTYDVLHSRHRSPADALIGHARATEGAVLVIATEGHLGLRSTSPANVTHRVVTHAPVPVLVTHSSELDELPPEPVPG